MPDTRGRPLPSEILQLLKDPSITNYLRSFLLSVASSESIGRYPGNGSAQNDIYPYPDDADATFPYNFDYVIPANFQRLVSAKLSFKIRAYRTYSTFTPGATTGGESVTHTHTSATHNHNHGHTIPIGAGPFTNAVGQSAAGGQLQDAFGPTTAPVNADATNTTPGATGANTVDHTHTMSGTSVLGIAEDVAPVNPGITVSVDGTDVTTALGGPFNSDQVEIDVTQVLKTAVKLWHTLSLQPNKRVRISGLLRLGYYTDNRLAQ